MAISWAVYSEMWCLGSWNGLVVAWVSRCWSPGLDHIVSSEDVLYIADTYRGILLHRPRCCEAKKLSDVVRLSLMPVATKLEDALYAPLPIAGNLI